jgi:hypothetical protein
VTAAATDSPAGMAARTPGHGCSGRARALTGHGTCHQLRHNGSSDGQPLVAALSSTVAVCGARSLRGAHQCRPVPAPRASLAGESALGRHTSANPWSHRGAAKRNAQKDLLRAKQYYIRKVQMQEAPVQFCPRNAATGAGMASTPAPGRSGPLR